MEPDAALVRELLRVKPLKEQARREHHPFYTPQECRDFIRRVLKRPTPQASLYAQSILFMCQHGLRPEEFEGGHFLVDEETGHLRIEGTKTPNAKRIVPILSFVEPDSLPKFATLNRLFERMGAPVRCRDFRRTYSIWCQRAQIPQNHVSAYMGHAAETVTQTYQGVVPKHMILDEDRSKLLTWYEYELAKANTVRKKPVPMTQVRALQKALKPSPADLEAAIAAMVADADEFPTD